LNMEVSRANFLLIGPIVLAALTIYQHIYIGYQRTLGIANDRRALPFIFNLPNRSERLITGFLIYWLVPLVLFDFSYRTTWLPVGGVQVIITAMVTTGLVWL
jgi:hypothetical protein